jgi:hypothetical protein
MLCDLVTNAQPYTVLILIYITLFELRKKIFSEEWNEGENNKYSWIPKQLARWPTSQKWIYKSSWNSIGINLGGWLGDYNIQSTDLCRITTCNVLLYTIVDFKSSLELVLYVWFISTLNKALNWIEKLIFNTLIA